MNEKVRRLRIWTGRPVEDTEPVPLPSPGDVLYAGPNPDGSRKKCGNCFLWRTDESCSVHRPEIMVPGNAVCGYHVFGQPQDFPFAEAMLTPAETGLVQTLDGTSCDLCKYYQPVSRTLGSCRAVQDPGSGTSAVVRALGCCSRWSGLELL